MHFLVYHAIKVIKNVIMIRAEKFHVYNLSTLDYYEIRLYYY